MSPHSPFPLSRFDKNNLIDELLKMEPDIVEHDRYLNNQKRSAEGLATSRGGSWYDQRREISAFTEFIRAIQWYIWNLSRPAGLEQSDVPKVKRYAEHMVAKGKMPAKAVAVLDRA